MKHRIVSILLALALVLTLVPVVAHATEDSTGFKASAELIEVIKKWEGFAKYPVWDYGQWSVGYGTRAPDEHLERYRTEGIGEEEATQLLDGFMNDMGQSVNSFIKKHGMTVTQGQFDAMLSLTYNCGSKWMLEVSTLRTAILDGWTGSDFIFAFGQWSTAGGSTLLGLVRRRLAEANMYLNGQYNAAPPSNYCYVRYNGNGGSTEVITQGYDSADAPVAIRAVPAYEGRTFEGWYTDPTGGEKVEKLDATMNGYMLYAHWSAGDAADQPQDDTQGTITGTPVSYTQEVISKSLNVFQQPVKGSLVVDTVTEFELVEIVAEHKDSAGITWGQIKDGGWINLNYTQQPVETESAAPVEVTVKGTSVNIRRGPDTSYGVVMQVNTGKKLTITRTTTAGGYTWGKCDEGWVALKYTNYDEVVNNELDKEEDTQKTVTGKVSCNDNLHIRKSPGVGNSIVGYLTSGTQVEILEQKAVGGLVWGRIDRGWICMSYVTLDETDDDNTGDDNTGDDNTGDDNTGDDNTGDDNTGDDNTGDDNTGDDNTGDDNTEEETDPVDETAGGVPEGAIVGTVDIISGKLNVRGGPGGSYDVVNTYPNESKIVILETQMVGTVKWGRTVRGWVNLLYVEYEEPEDDTAEGRTGTVNTVSGWLNVRSGPGVSYGVVTSLPKGTKVTVTETQTVGGSQWGHISQGWVSMAYIKLDPETTPDDSQGGNQGGNQGGSDSTDPGQVTGTVKVSDNLRYRSGPGTNHSIVGYAYNNDKVTILEQQTVGGTKWGRTAKGWICLDYVVLDQQPSEDEDDNTGTTTSTGTVTASALYIRKGAGTGNAIVGSLMRGEKVTILETKTVGSEQWGRVEKGWICLTYVKMD